MKKNKGITLISLVVTIIVIVILIGISIMMLTGENGILERAKQAKNETEIEQIEDLVKLSIIEAKTEEMGKITSTEILDKALKNNIGEGEYILEGNIEQGWKIIIGNTTYIINTDGTLTKEETEHEQIILSENTKILAIFDTVAKEEEITATLLNMSGTITWTSSNEECVKVTQTEETAVLTPIATGTATITAICNGKTSKCDVTVIKITNTISLENATEIYADITVRVEGIENTSINIRKPDDKIENSNTVTYRVNQNGNYKFEILTEKGNNFEYFVNVTNVEKELIEENISEDDFTLNAGSSGKVENRILDDNSYYFSFGAPDWNTPRSYGEWSSVKEFDFSKYNTCTIEIIMSGYSERGKYVEGWIKIGNTEVWRKTRSFPGWSHSGDGLPNDYTVDIDLKSLNISGLQSIIVGRRFETNALLHRNKNKKYYFTLK